MFFTLTSTFIASHYWFELHFVPSKLHLHLHDMTLDSFIHVIKLKTLKFKSFVLFQIYALLDNSIIASNISI